MTIRRASGTLLFLALLVAAIGFYPSDAQAQPPWFIRTWGTEGTAPDQFDFPFGVAIDSQGYIYVSNRNSHRIQRFSPSGEYLTSWGPELGLQHPTALAVDSSDNIYVTDSFGQQFYRFTSSGQLLDSWPCPTDVRDCSPNGIAVDEQGFIYVADSINDRILKYNPSGTLVRQWGSEGSRNGQFRTPVDVELDGEGNVYVIDLENYRFQKFDSNGRFLSRHDLPFLNRSLAGWGIDPRRERIYHIETRDGCFGSGTIQTYSLNFRLLDRWDYHGFGSSDSGALDVEVGPTGRIYVMDSIADRVMEFGHRPASPLPSGQGVGQADLRLQQTSPLREVRGDNLYDYCNAVSGDQTSHPLGGARARYVLRVEQDGNNTERITLRSTTSTAHFRVAYFEGNRNVTQAVARGTYRTPPLPPGGRVLLRMEVDPRSNVLGIRQPKLT